MIDQDNKKPLIDDEQFKTDCLEENYNKLKVLPLTVIFFNGLFLLQYRFAPGREVLSIYLESYITLFFLALVISLFFRTFLPVFHRIKKKNIQEIIYLTYMFLMFIFCIALTVLDQEKTLDFTAYSIGLFTLAFLLRIEPWKFISLSIAGFFIYLAAYFFILPQQIHIENVLPILMITILNVYLVFSREKTRQEMSLLKNKLQDSALKDPLTNLYNRRYMIEFLNKQIALYKRYGTNSSIILFDIDFFKKVNDLLGHGIGDDVLIEISDILLKEIRDTDMACRYGGEEFVIVLSDTNKERAYVIAERIRMLIENHLFTSVAWTITTSIGLVDVQHNDMVEAILKEADENLYRAKESGRNKTVI